jgi:hypothetical protein
MDALSEEFVIERALQRALHSFVAGYGTTSTRIALNPNTGLFDPVTGLTGGGSVILEWPGDCKTACRDKAYPLVVNVDYSVDGESTLIDTDTIEDAFLQYEWGDIGHMAQVDLTRGHPVSLAGSRAVIRAFYPRVVTVDPVTTQPSIELRASIGVGSENSAPGITGSARRTIRYGTVPAAAVGVPGLSPIFKIPPWAVAAVLVNSDALVSTLLFRQLLNFDPTSQISEVDLGKFNGISVPIANGARWARVANAGATPQVARIMYFLAIGA